MNIVNLDVRGILRANGNPFKFIMGNVEEMHSQSVLQLHTPFPPAPLFRVLAKRGYRHVMLKLKQKHYITQFHKDAAEPAFIIDLRGHHHILLKKTLKEWIEALYHEKDPIHLRVYTKFADMDKVTKALIELQHHIPFIYKEVPSEEPEELVLEIVCQTL